MNGIHIDRVRLRIMQDELPYHVRYDFPPFDPSFEFAIEGTVEAGLVEYDWVLEVRDRLLSKTRSLCPTCGETVDARLDSINGRVVMSKTCDLDGNFRSLISSDASHYIASLPFNKPGTSPLGM